VSAQLPAPILPLHYEEKEVVDTTFTLVDFNLGDPVSFWQNGVWKKGKVEYLSHEHGTVTIRCSRRMVISSVLPSHVTAHYPLDS